VVAPPRQPPPTWGGGRLPVRPRARRAVKRELSLTPTATSCAGTTTCPRASRCRGRPSSTLAGEHGLAPHSTRAGSAPDEYTRPARRPPPGPGARRARTPRPRRKAQARRREGALEAHERDLVERRRYAFLNRRARASPDGDPARHRPDLRRGGAGLSARQTVTRFGQGVTANPAAGPGGRADRALDAAAAGALPRAWAAAAASARLATSPPASTSSSAPGSVFGRLLPRRGRVGNHRGGGDVGRPLQQRGLPRACGGSGSERGGPAPAWRPALHPPRQARLG
jgi:hypothetical protein